MKILMHTEVIIVSGGESTSVDMYPCFFLFGETRDECFEAATTNMQKLIDAVPASEWNCKITDLTTGIETKINCQTKEVIL